MRLVPLCLCICLCLLLLASCGADARRPGPMSDNIGTHTLDFAGDRHTLLVTFRSDPRDGAGLTVATPSDREQPFDLELRNEAGYPARITGNGRRSIAFLGIGGRELFNTACANRAPHALRAALPETDVYFTPGLRREQLVDGCVFLAQIERGVNGTEKIGMARILVEEIGDTTVRLKAWIGPAW